MEFDKVIDARVSTRSFNDKIISDEDIKALLHSANRSPIANGAYDKCRLTVITDRKLLDKIIKEYQEERKLANDPLYGASTFILFSSSKDTNAKYEDAGCILENIGLKATDLGISSVYIRGAINSLGNDAAYIKDLGLEDGFYPVSGIALGYSDSKVQAKEHEIITNFIG